MKELSVSTVYPTKESALFLVHPTHGPLSAEGSVWPNDLFTKRRLTDGSVTLTKPVVASTAKASKDVVDTTASTSK